MSARAESLAKQFEAKAAEMTAVVAKLSDADWKKITSAEKWPVGVTAHHLRRAVPELVRTGAFPPTTPPDRSDGEGIENGSLPVEQNALVVQVLVHQPAGVAEIECLGHRRE